MINNSLVGSLFFKIINAGIQLSSQPEEQKKIRIVNLTAFVGVVATVCFSLLNVFLGFAELVMIDLLVAAVAAFAYVLNITHRVRACRFVTFVVLPLAIMIYPVFIGNIGTEYYNFLFLTIGFYIFDNKKQLFALTFFIGAIFITSKYCIANFTFPEKYKILETVHYYPCLVVSIALTLLVVMLFKFDTLEYQTKINQQNKELEQKLQELAEQNTLSNALLRELNHRVKNNLQLISSLFIMQSYKTRNEQTRQALAEARIRIDTVSIMHQRMYRDTVSMESNLRDYIKELSNYVLQASGSDEVLHLEAVVDELYLKIEDTLHVGLIVNELLTNAIKYGTPTAVEVQNMVSLHITRVHNSLHIEMQDSGAGFPNDFSIIQANSFGMTLIGAIVTQHAGSIVIENRNGAHIAIVMDVQFERIPETA